MTDTCPMNSETLASLAAILPKLYVNTLYGSPIKHTPDEIIWQWSDGSQIVVRKAKRGWTYHIITPDRYTREGPRAFPTHKAAFVAATKKLKL